jgi:hypothetical protein
MSLRAVGRTLYTLGVWCGLIEVLCGVAGIAHWGSIYRGISLDCISE